MRAYIRRRILISIPILVAVTVAIYALLNLAPGDPLMAMLAPDQHLDPAAARALQAQYGLDKPAPVRYAIWLGQVLRGNLGRSYALGRPVAQLIAERLPNTLLLMGVALCLAVLLGLLLGTVSAVLQYSPVDYLVTAFAFLWIAIPNFFLGLALIYVFGVRLDVLPACCVSTYGSTAPLWDRVVHLILPAGALGLEQAAVLMRFTRSSVLEVLGKDYMRTARAKGLARWTAIRSHGLPNALIPIITVIGFRLPALFGGSIIIETVFQWPGTGLLFANAADARDYPTVMGITLLSAVMVLASNLLADIAYAAADPRIRYS